MSEEAINYFNSNNNKMSYDKVNQMDNKMRYNRIGHYNI